MTYTSADLQSFIRHAALMGFQQGFRTKTAEQMDALDLDAMCAGVVNQMEHDGLIEGD